MATFSITLYVGNNLISVPLDMSGAEDDPKVIFNPNMRNSNDDDYLYKHIKSNSLIT